MVMRSKKKTTTKTTSTSTKSPVKKKPVSTATKSAPKATKAPAQKKVMKEAPVKEAVKATTTATKHQHHKEPVMPYKYEAYQTRSGEAYMSEGQLLHFRQILEDWKKELMKEVDHTLTEMKEADVLPDPNDRATQEETFNLELRTRDRERKLIRKIEEALKQIDEKDYGYCESCGVEIGIRRLEARPTAALCIDCKTLEEIRERTSQ